ncbi:DUF6608 family protein [Mucilaginibacter rigui]|uniref:DUF6608 family protein n=1 Tax=Mucilaginibacter rigui TaxID=534635 RepID=UPI00374388AA
MFTRVSSFNRNILSLLAILFTTIRLFNSVKQMYKGFELTVSSYCHLLNKSLIILSILLDAVVFFMKLYKLQHYLNSNFVIFCPYHLFILGFKFHYLVFKVVVKGFAFRSKVQHNNTGIIGAFYTGNHVNGFQFFYNFACALFGNIHFCGKLVI